ncbi:GNAT family N-acetyltransferase [Dehalobacterium formicoaceticum]|uniref:GNAT family N-acetyltransferase n=1 Tax=Dehalobacterium formicoaceticum TaxID=51515 RepID=UPI000B801F96|nr:GNAT family N-acetyltransferase [Dehalobacterium formicoaceticum]
MIKIRLAEDGDIGEQKEIWRLCFGDSLSFIDYYYQHRYRKEETMLLWTEEKLAAMLTMIPVKLQLPREESLTGRMLYAIATHPAFQKRGLATRLMDYTHRYAEEMKDDFTVLVPAHQALFDFYRKQGYREGFYLREAVWNKDEGIKEEKQFPLRMTKITPDLYNKRRNKFLLDKIYISYEEREIFYQQSLSQSSGGNLYALDMPGVQGCAAIEGVGKSEYLIKEILLPEKFLAEALKKIAQILAAEKIIFRTPGTQRPFAMIRETGTFPLGLGSERGAYLGLAFD